jgi:hypothetical protein
MLEAMNEFEQILAHLSGCQRAFVLPPCPAEWLPTNSPRLADPAKMSTPHYNQILLFHTLPQLPNYPLQSPNDAPSDSPQFLHVGAALRRLSSRGRTFMSDISDIQIFPRLWSSSRAPSLAPSPLRTGLEGFPFIRLEHSKTPP